jgi:hypothetical protein
MASAITRRRENARFMLPPLHALTRRRSLRMIAGLLQCRLDGVISPLAQGSHRRS